MSELDKFAEIFHRRLEGAKQAQLRFAVCESVNWEEKTMTALGVSDDVPYEGVQLGFGYVDVKPAKNSVCLIGILEGKEALTFLINAENIELVEVKTKDIITINGGKNGGLTITPKLVQELNKTNQVLQAVITILTGAPIPEPGNNSPSALQGALSLALTGKQVGDFSEIENKKITH